MMPPRRARELHKRLGKKAKRGFRGFPVGTIAFYGPDDRRATKLVAAVIAKEDDPSLVPLPLLGRLVPAGFPSPADDYLEGEIDLNRYLIERPAACYLMRVSGNSMSGAGIMDRDIVVVDRSVEAVPGHVVVAVIDGEMTIKRLRRLRDGRLLLKAENPEYPSTV